MHTFATILAIKLASWLLFSLFSIYDDIGCVAGCFSWQCNWAADDQVNVWTSWASSGSIAVLNHRLYTAALLIAEATAMHRQ